MLEKIKGMIENTVYKVGISKAKKKNPIIEDLFENPENLKLEASFEGEEIIIKVKRKTES